CGDSAGCRGDFVRIPDGACAALAVGESCTYHTSTGIYGTSVHDGRITRTGPFDWEIELAVKATLSLESATPPAGACATPDPSYGAESHASLALDAVVPTGLS